MSEHDFLTTREVADLLRVRERKVYELATAGKIPHRRLIGKLLFPRAEIQRWMSTPRDRPDVLAGSHDPLLDWAIRESQCGLAVLYDGSGDGLDRFARGEAALTGLHIAEVEDWNVSTVAAQGLSDCVLVGWARRMQGLILGQGVKGVSAMADLPGRRVAIRQKGAGGRALFDRLAADAGLGPDAIVTMPEPARTETDAAAAVAAGEAEAALGLASMARQFGLKFIPLIEERFDLLVCRRAWFTQPLQGLMQFARGPRLAEKASSFGGYDLDGLGEVRWLAP